MTIKRHGAVGDRPFPRLFGPVTQTDIVRFAGAGGDFNPLHHDTEQAQRAGFATPIAMGQFTAALLAGWLTDQFGVENLRSLEVRFTAPVHLGDVVELSGVVTELDEDTARVDLMAAVGDKPVVTGKATVLLPRQQS